MRTINYERAIEVRDKIEQIRKQFEEIQEEYNITLRIEYQSERPWDKESRQIVSSVDSVVKYNYDEKEIIVLKNRSIDSGTYKMVKNSK